MVDIWNCLRRIINGMDDFEGFLLAAVTLLFSLLFIRVLVACFMGQWNILI